MHRLLKNFYILSLLLIFTIPSKIQDIYYRTFPEERILDLDLFIGLWGPERSGVFVIDYLSKFTKPPNITGLDGLRFLESFTVLNASRTYTIYHYQPESLLTDKSISCHVEFNASEIFEFHLEMINREYFVRSKNFYIHPDKSIFYRNFNISYSVDYSKPFKIRIDDVDLPNPNNNFFLLDDNRVGLFAGSLSPGSYILKFDDYDIQDIFVVDYEETNSINWFESEEVIWIFEDPVKIDFSPVTSMISCNITFNGQKAASQNQMIVEREDEIKNTLIFFGFMKDVNSVNVTLYLKNDKKPKLDTYDDDDDDDDDETSMQASWKVFKKFIDTDRTRYTDLIMFLLKNGMTDMITVKRFHQNNSDQPPTSYLMSDRVITPVKNEDDVKPEGNSTWVIVNGSILNTMDVILGFEESFNESISMGVPLISIIMDSSESAPVNITLVFHFPNLSKNVSVHEAICVWLDETNNSYSSDGCETTSNVCDKEFRVVCSCNHLTSFTVLFGSKLEGTPTEIASMDATSYINVVTSVICLTYVIIRSISRPKLTNTSFELICIAINFWLLYAVFLIEYFLVPHQKLCYIWKFIGAFFSMSSVQCLCLVSFRAFKRLAITQIYQSVTLEKYFMFTTYFMPMILVLILGRFHSEPLPYKKCVLDGNSLNYVVLPYMYICCIISCSLCSFTLWSVTNKLSICKNKDTVALIKLIVALVVLSGISWMLIFVVGYHFIIDNLFNIINGSYGVILFIFYDKNNIMKVISTVTRSVQTFTSSRINITPTLSKIILFDSSSGSTK